MKDKKRELTVKLNRQLLLLSALLCLCILPGVYFCLIKYIPSWYVLYLSLCSILFCCSLIYLKRQIISPLKQLETQLEQLRSAYSLPECSMTELALQLETAIENKYTTQILYTQAQIDALQSQINPHFLYNTLEEIRGLALINDQYDISDMTEALALMFRYSISQDNKNVTFEQELHNLESYILIQQFRFPDKFSLQYDFDKSDERLMNYRLPKLTLQPIVENAIQHGFHFIEHNGLITIRAIATQNRLLIRVSDNGQGMPPHKLEQLNQILESDSALNCPRASSGKTGIALINVNLRIKLNYGSEYGLFVSSVCHVGTTVEVRLPLLEE